MAMHIDNALLRIRYSYSIRNEAYVYMKSDLTSCRRYLISRPLYLRDANLVTQRAGVEHKRVWILYIHMLRFVVLKKFIVKNVISWHAISGTGEIPSPRQLLLE